MREAYYMHGTSGFNYMALPIPHSSLSAINLDTVHRRLGDTLSLLVEHNPDSVPVEWIVDGVSHLGDAYSFLPIFTYPDEIKEYRMEIYNR